MRTISVMALLIVAINLSAFAQKLDPGKIPAIVKTAFIKQFSDVPVKWEKEDGKYEASFKIKGNYMSALFDTNGNMTESETTIKETELPADVVPYLKEHYKGKNIKESAKIIKADSTIIYEAAIGGKDVLFDANGKFLKEAKE